MNFNDYLEGLGLKTFISFDLDYYSSTKQALQIFEGPAACRLPRVLCYFDDTIQPLRAYLNEYIGELLAIQEFNDGHERQKITAVRGLSLLRYHSKIWNEQTFVHHDFDHELYKALITPAGQASRQKPLR